MNFYNRHSQQCEQCLNLIERTRHRCLAYLRGIPPEVWNDEIDHTRPYFNDDGIQFEQKVLPPYKQRKTKD